MLLEGLKGVSGVSWNLQGFSGGPWGYKRDPGGVSGGLRGSQECSGVLRKFQRESSRGVSWSLVAVSVFQGFRE